MNIHVYECFSVLLWFCLYANLKKKEKMKKKKKKRRPGEKEGNTSSETRGKRGARRAEEEREEKMEGEGNERERAVSYTHLTLPTRRTV